MNRFAVGEEVRYEGDVYVVSQVTREAPYEYRLLATGAAGTRFVRALEEQLEPMEGYRRPRDDTNEY